MNPFRDDRFFSRFMFLSALTGLALMWYAHYVTSEKRINYDNEPLIPEDTDPNAKLFRKTLTGLWRSADGRFSMEFRNDKALIMGDGELLYNGRINFQVGDDITAHTDLILSTGDYQTENGRVFARLYDSTYGDYGKLTAFFAEGGNVYLNIEFPDHTAQFITLTRQQ
jgi:hypothetical protein